jgi:hypothetical protein
MPSLTRWTVRTLAAAVATLAVAGPAGAQVKQFQAPGAWRPAMPGQPRQNPVQVMPQINTVPGIPAYNPFASGPGPSVLEPSFPNPWANPNPNPVVAPRRPRINPFALFNNPFALNPLLANPLQNPIGSNSFIGMPSAASPLAPAFAIAPGAPIAAPSPDPSLATGPAPFRIPDIGLPAVPPGVVVKPARTIVFMPYIF